MDTKTICLAVLCQGDTTGYEIKKAFEEGPFSYFQDVSFGSIYPALNRALAENLVSVTELSQLGRPGKKVYSISQAGRAALLDNMTKETPDDKVTSDFLFKLMFSKLLAPEDLEAIIESRLTFLDGKISDMEGLAAEGGMQAKEDFVCGFGLALYRTMRSYIEANRHKLQATRDDAEQTAPTQAAE